MSKNRDRRIPVITKGIKLKNRRITASLMKSGELRLTFKRLHDNGEIGMEYLRLSQEGCLATAQLLADALGKALV